jgi:hypothetical protein
MFSRMFRLTILVLSLAIVALPSSARVRLGAISLGFGYARYTGYCCYGPYAYDGFYGPYWGPFGPYYPDGYFSKPAPDKGTVKLIKANKAAEVYIDKAGEPRDPQTVEADRKTIAIELKEKQLPAGSAAKTVAGYLYFPAPDKKGAALDLEYQGPAGNVIIPLPAPAE